MWKEISKLKKKKKVQLIEEIYGHSCPFTSCDIPPPTQKSHTSDYFTRFKLQIHESFGGKTLRTKQLALSPRRAHTLTQTPFKFDIYTRYLIANINFFFLFLKIKILNAILLEVLSRVGKIKNTPQKLPLCNHK